MGRRFLSFVAALASILFIASTVFAGGIVKFGVQAPITGQFANEGQGIANAVKLLAEEQNAKGGLLGKKIKVIVCDDQGTAQQAAICARNLVNAGVIAVIGSYTSTCTQVAEPIYYRAGILQTSDGTSNALTKPGYWTFFRNSFPNSAEAKFAAKFLVKVKKYKRIALISDYSVYSTGLANQYAQYIKKLGGNIIFRGKIRSGSQNFTPILTKVKSLHADVIVFTGYYTDAGLMRAQEVQLGMKADFVGGDSTVNPDFNKLAGKAAAGTYAIYVPTPQQLPYPEAKKFLKAYKAKYHMLPPSIWTLTNADGFRAIVYGIEKTKTFNTKKVADFLHHLKDFPGITGPITFNSKGERLSNLFMAFRRNKEGKLVLVYREK